MIFNEFSCKITGFGLNLNGILSGVLKINEIPYIRKTIIK